MSQEHPAFVRARALPEHVREFFPQTIEEARTWAPHVLWRALAGQVLAVAVPRVECAWRAYIDSVPGIDHCAEYERVASHGASLDEDVARALFPNFDAVPYAR